MTLVTACGPADQAPVFDSIPGGQVAYVGSEYDLTLRASDPEGDALRFSFSAAKPADLAARATITQFNDGSARFSWKTPVKSDADLGTVAIDFSVSDGQSSVTQSVSIQVQGTTGSNQRPEFVSPLGAGTTLDLARAKCLDLEVTVQDPGVPRVDIAQRPPVIDGATLTPDGDHSARWHWCPSAAQIDGADVYTLLLGASDGLGKTYSIVLRKPSCSSGSPPTVASSPADVTTPGNVTLTAQASDDKGLKQPPTLYWTTNAPATPVDVTQLNPLAMSLASGTLASGTFTVDVPNPAAAGGSASLYYVVVASDSDDPTGGCNHTTQSSLYHLTVTNPGGAGDLPPCAPCARDDDCGGAGDACVPVGGADVCGKGCAGAGDCPDGYGCQAVTSVDGAAGLQCVPLSGSCAVLAPPSCTDDSHEPDDDIATAAGRPALDLASSVTGTSCPDGAGGTNADWYRLDVPEDAEITIELAGGPASDLDLQLTDDQGNALATSAGVTSDETVAHCLAAGSYYVKVYSSTWAPAANDYTLSVAGASQSCAPATCVPDGYEPDDDWADAWAVDASGGADHFTGRTICAGDVDWYWLHLAAGDTLYVALTFNQQSARQDLDLDVWAGGTELTPCTLDVPCSAATGQSSDSNEYYVHTADADADYFVGVLGYDGSENSYDICFSLSAGQCPVYP